jgi:tetratricopeptide (TPR) repeat protein
MKKICRTLLFSFFYILQFFLLSCVSGEGLAVPGESAIRRTNIAAEYYAIAEGYYGLKNYAKAAEYYEKAMFSKDLRQQSYYKMGHCYALAKNWTKAEEVYANLYKKDLENTNLMASLAYIKAMSGKTKEACKLYEQICEKNPDDSSFLANYITILITEENYTLAEEKLNLLTEKFPDESAGAELKKKLDELKPKTEEQTNLQENKDASVTETADN